MSKDLNADDETVEEPQDPPIQQPCKVEIGDVDAAVAAMDASLTKAVDNFEVWSMLKGDEQNLPDELRGQLQTAWFYRLELETDGKAGCKLVVDESWPTPVAKMPTATLELWAGIASKATAPAVIARFEDLLFCRGEGNGLQRATRAAAAYCDAVDDQSEDHLVAEYLLRAWTLSRQVRNQALGSRVHDRLTEVAERVIVDGDPFSLGPLLAILTVLAAPSTLPSTLDIEAALTHLASLAADPIIASEVASLRRKRHGNTATLEQLGEIARDELAAYERMATYTTVPLIKQHHLENAAKRAAELGLTKDAKRLVVEMQKLGPEVLRNMHTFTTETSVPRAGIEAFARRYTRSPSWVTSLQSFFYSSNPAGGLSSHRKFAESGRSSLRRLIGAGLIGADGLTREHQSTEAKQDHHDMNLSTASRAEFVGDLLADALFRMQRRYGTPTEPELVDAILAFKARNIDNARTFAKALHHFWARDFDTCVHLAVPRFEGAARELLLELNVGIYRLPSGDNPGDYPGLFYLLKELELHAMDEEWIWFFRWLMLGPGGRNLRNDVAHGAAVNVSPIHAALALRALAVMVLAAPDPHDSTNLSVRPITRRNGLAAIPDLLLTVASKTLGRAAMQLHDLRARPVQRREVPRAQSTGNVEKDSS